MLLLFRLMLWTQLGLCQWGIARAWFKFRWQLQRYAGTKALPRAWVEHEPDDDYDGYFRTKDRVLSAGFRKDGKSPARVMMRAMLRPMLPQIYLETLRSPLKFRPAEHLIFFMDARQYGLEKYSEKYLCKIIFLYQVLQASQWGGANCESLWARNLARLEAARADNGIETDLLPKPIPHISQEKRSQASCYTRFWMRLIHLPIWIAILFETAQAALAFRLQLRRWVLDGRMPEEWDLAYDPDEDVKTEIIEEYKDLHAHARMGHGDLLSSIALRDAYLMVMNQAYQLALKHPVRFRLEKNAAIFMEAPAVGLEKQAVKYIKKIMSIYRKLQKHGCGGSEYADLWARRLDELEGMLKQMDL